MNVFDKARKAIEDAYEPTAAALTQQIRQFANQANWPEDVSSKLSVKQENGSFSYHWPKSINDKVMGLEYGDYETPPNPVFRRHRNRTDDAMNYLVNRAWKNMGGLR